MANGFVVSGYSVVCHNAKDERLKTLSTALNVGKVASIVGIGVSLYLASIPGIDLCGAALVACLIGGRAIRLE